MRRDRQVDKRSRSYRTSRLEVRESRYKSAVCLAVLTFAQRCVPASALLPLFLMHGSLSSFRFACPYSTYNIVVALIIACLRREYSTNCMPNWSSRRAMCLTRQGVFSSFGGVFLALTLRCQRRTTNRFTVVGGKLGSETSFYCTQATTKK